MKNINTENNQGLNWGGIGSSRRAGRDHMGENADILIVMNKCGLSANGTPRFSLVFRFSHDAVKKVSPRSAYSNAAIVEDLHRIYFREDRAGTGKKLTNTSTNGKNREIRFTVSASDREELKPIEGSYLLLYDNEKNLYYIDWTQKLVDDFRQARQR